MIKKRIIYYLTVVGGGREEVQPCLGHHIYYRYTLGGEIVLSPYHCRCHTLVNLSEKKKACL